MTIEMDSDIDEAMLATAEEAIARWDARAEVRKARNEALAARRPLEADTRTRLAARVNNLVADVRLSSRGRRPPSNPTLKALVERPTPVTPEEIDESIVQEVIVGARDFLSIEFLERGLLASRSVGRVLVSSGSGLKARGTGFLVAPGLLLTNHHVLTSRELAVVCSVEMDYEQNRLGPPKQPQVFSFEPDRFFLNDAALDYALVAVAATSDRGVALANYGWLTLNAAQGKIVVSDQDYLNIIQHPLGREKEVVIRNNRILDLRTSNDAAADALGPFLHYEGDTEKGSSGSVLNDQWNVVALHHSGVPARDAQGNWLDKEGHVWRRGQQSISEIRWVANEAIRVSSLVAAIQHRAGGAARTRSFQPTAFGPARQGSAIAAKQQKLSEKHSPVLLYGSASRSGGEGPWPLPSLGSLPAARPGLLHQRQSSYPCASPSASAPSDSSGKRCAAARRWIGRRSKRRSNPRISRIATAMTARFSGLPFRSR